MSRRSSRRSGNTIIKDETTEIEATPVATPTKVEAAQESITPIKAVARKLKVKAGVDSEEEKDIEAAPAKKYNINSVKAAGVTEKENKLKPKKAPVKRKAKTEDDEDGDKDEKTNVTREKKKRKTKEEKEAETMPLAERTLISALKKPMYIGAHVSAAKGVQNSVTNSLQIGGNAFALFLKSQRKWTSPPLAPDARDQFKRFCLEHKYDAAKHCLPHGSYLVNLAQADKEKASQAYECFLDDLRRCEDLGIKLYNFHPGNTGAHPRPAAIARIAEQLNKAHKETKTVITVLENMAGSGNVIGSTWEDLRDIIALVDDKTRVGVCIDTCHSFAAGYDLRSPEKFKETMDGFAKIVGMPYLKALHLNDSKAPFSSHRDLHANIGTGFLGLRAFHNIVNFGPFQDLPMVLETPTDKKGPDGKLIEDKSVWAAEIKLLESLIGVDAETEVFQKEEQRLQDIGAEEKKKFQGQADKKQQKTIDLMFKKTDAKKGKKRGKTESDGCDSDASEGGCSH